MSLTAVGSIAFDSVRTPFGERERMLGGSAVHFSLAATFFTEVRVVGPVGDDFGADEVKALEDRGVITDDIERVAGGETFFWRGHYEYDMNVAYTDDTQLNVFADFDPKLSPVSREASMLFLANIQPDLQRSVREQCKRTHFTGLDSMNYWIESARESLVETIRLVDAVVFNDAEVRMLTGKPNLAQAGREIRALGPSVLLVKQGAYGAAMFNEDGFFSIPAYPLETVIDPTGAGDAFAGGFFGFLDACGSTSFTDNQLRCAAVYGSVQASFCVEDFGSERLQRLTTREIAERFAEFERMTVFEAPELAAPGLRGVA
jgi:sugar/nucleoside kinase (ribokinase family)